MKSGIYIIKNKIDNKVYIGQSVHVKYRISTHKCLLDKNKHENSYLQNAYNKFGKDNFEFKLLELCEENKLDEREVYWISYYDSMNRQKGYNRESGGNTNKRFCKERIQRITGEYNPMFSKNHSDKSKNKIREANRGHNNKLTQNMVETIKERLSKGEECKTLANEYNVKISTISKINKCINWKWVREDLNDKLLNKNNITQQVIKLYEDGNSINKICSLLKKDQRVISKIVNPLKEKEIEKRSERNRNIINDFNNGTSKDKIIKKYNISKTTYTRIVRDSYSQNKKELIKKAKELKLKGYMNKEIAKELNLHRTTITEYLKK